MKWAWTAYKRDAWGHDELLPVSHKSSEWFHLGLTLVDALDTLYIMGLETEFKEARDWVASSLRLDQDQDVNLFECTIRVLGGLLSAHALSGDPVFLERAKDLGDRLLPAFTQSGIPYSDVNLGTHRAHKPRWGPDSSTAEVTTLQLEFKYLSKLTGNSVYREKVDGVMKHVNSLPKKDGLVPIFVNANTGRFSGSTITLGARGDSYYEYLLKQWLLTGKRETWLRDMYVESVRGIRKHLIRKAGDYTYVAELIGGRSSPKMDHLVCFLPGTLALGAANGLDHADLDLAKELMRTCVAMYSNQVTGLAPEIAHFHEHLSGKDAMYVKDADAHNLLRPETVESLFVLYRVTGDPIYQEWGYHIFTQFQRYTRLASGGYSSIHSVKEISVRYRDKMESFFLGETLKYIYMLLGSEDERKDVLPLDRWVLNTEAHPLPIFEW